MLDTSNPFASPLAETTVSESGVMGDHPEAFRKVRTGLSMVYYGICGILLSMLTLVITSILLPAMGAAGMGLLMVLMVVFVIGVLVLSIMILVGEAFCMAVPAESGAKGLATAAFLLAIIPLVSGIASLVLRVAANPDIAQMLNGIGSFAHPISMICFILFLRQTAKYIGRRDVAARATRALVVGIVAFLILIGGVVLMVVSLVGQGGAPEPPPAMIITFGLGMLTMLVAFLMYANTITYLRKAITV